MKKILKSTVAILTIISCLLALVSCARPKKNLESAKNNLRHNGYTVTNTPSGNIAQILNGITAEDGVPYSLITATTDDYKITYLTLIECNSVKLAKMIHQAIRLQLETQIKENKLAIKTAKHILNKFGDELEDAKRQDYEQLIIDLKEENAELRDKLIGTGRSGKYVWTGDITAIRATKQ